MQYKITIDSTEKLIEVGERLRGAFVFRGHASMKWDFETTIERAAKKWNMERKYLFEREQIILREFQRRAHHYLKEPPQLNKTFEWMALLQHYGGPTRLLDVTESFLVATFFAIENPVDDGVVWAFNNGLFKSEIDSKNIFSFNQEKEGLILAEPFWLNQRLAIQKGKFLFPSSISKSFKSQLYKITGSTLDIFEEIKTDDELNKTIMAKVWKIILPKEGHSEIMRFLSNSNITAATLFEGLEGFARSLNIMMRIND